MTLKRTLPFALTLLPALCFAQLRIYFNEYLQPVDSGRPYSYYEEVRQYSNGTVRIKVFDKAGFPISDGSYSSFGQTGKEQKEEGMHRFYRPGQKIPWYQQEFKNGIKEGDLSSWYPTGEVKRIEHFHEDKSVGGECFAQDGSVIPFTPFTKMPAFPGGEKALEAFLEKNLKYPDDMYDYGIEGDVVVDLYIDESGAHPRLLLVQSTEYGFQQEMYRIINQMPFWKPGALDDEIKPLFARVTIPFRLQKESQKRKKVPGNKRFDLIEDVIGTGKRFYLDGYRNRVNQSAAHVMSGTAQKQTDSTVYIKLYDQADSLIYEHEYTSFNKLFESETIRNIVAVKSKVSNDSTYVMQMEDNPGNEIHTPPSFPGGDLELMKYLARNINYPNAAKEHNVMGIIAVSFVVNKIGRITDIKLVKDIGYGCGTEAIRVVNEMPLWSPGKVNGVPVKVRFFLPIRFVLD